MKNMSLMISANDIGNGANNINDTNDNNNYNNELFGSDIKEKFLSTIKEGTRQSYRRIFTITNKFESALNKDLNKFTLKEIEVILHSFKSDNRNTVESYGRIMSSYLNWSVDNGLTSQNVLRALNPKDFEKFIVDNTEYLTYKDLLSLENQCENYQDAVILRLLFIGINGRESSEIRNLKKSDVDVKNNQLKLINTLKYDNNGLPLKYTERLIDIDSYTLNLIRGAINQKTYLKRNGHVEQTANENIRDYTDLVNNDYVMRASITRTDAYNTPVDKFVIYRRLKMLSEVLEVEPLTVRHIQRSGMLHYAGQLTNKGNDDVSLYDLKMVADKFNMKSYHNLKGFLTKENIKKYYSN